MEYGVDLVDVSAKRDSYVRRLGNVDRVVCCRHVLSPSADDADVHYCSNAMYLLDFDVLFLLKFSS